jgi:hypothetical protein
MSSPDVHTLTGACALDEPERRGQREPPSG